jgi:alkaline phosphatase D
MSVMTMLLIAASLLLPATARAQGGPPPLTRIAFGSCADEEKPQPIWTAVLSYRPELFLFAGDNVYGDIRNGRAVAEPDLIDSLQDAYSRASRIPGLASLRSTVPHLATWDDHDFGKNDAGADFAGRQDAQRLFLQFWDVPLSDERHRRGGVYHAQTFGPEGQRVQVILLDTRFFRSPLKPTDRPNASGREHYVPDDSPGKTMLGDVQWSWLADRLREPADLRLIVSSIQVLAEGHGWERWGNLPRERQRLFDLIRGTGAKGVLFVSGDRHIGGIYRETNGVPYPLVEITSSGLNQAFAANSEAGPNRLGAVYGAANFGTADIDWWEGRVTLSLRNEANEVVRHVSVRLDELRSNARVNGEPQ